MTDLRVYKIKFHGDEPGNDTYQMHIDKTRQAIANHDGFDVDIIVEFHEKHHPFINRFISHWKNKGYSCSSAVTWTSLKEGTPSIITIDIKVRKSIPLLRNDEKDSMPILEETKEMEPDSTPEEKIPVFECNYVEDEPSGYTSVYYIFDRLLDTTKKAIMHHGRGDYDLLFIVDKKEAASIALFIEYWRSMKFNCVCTPIVGKQHTTGLVITNIKAMGVVLSIRKEHLEANKISFTKDENGLPVPVMSVKLDQSSIKEANIETNSETLEENITVSITKQFSSLNEQSTRLKDFNKAIEEKLETLRRAEGNLSVIFKEQDEDLMEPFKIYWRKKSFIVENHYKNPLMVVLFVFQSSNQSHPYFNDPSAETHTESCEDTKPETLTLAKQYRQKILEAHIKETRDKIELDICKRKATILLPFMLNELFSDFVEYWRLQDFRCHIGPLKEGSPEGLSLVIEW